MHQTWKQLTMRRTATQLTKHFESHEQAKVAIDGGERSRCPNFRRTQATHSD